MTPEEARRKSNEAAAAQRRMAPRSSPARTTSGMSLDEFATRAREMGRGLYRAIVETPDRLRKVYSQPPASGPGGMKGVENTAVTGARGLRGLGKALEQAGK